MSTEAVPATTETLREWPLPDPGGGKEARGRLLVIGGSVESPGAVRLAGEAAHIGQGLVEVGDDVGAAFEERLARQGERHVARRALEQASPEVDLEPGDGAADVGFRYAERPRRRREALQRRHLLEHPQGVEIEHAALSLFAA